MKKTYKSMFRNVLCLALTAVMLLSGMMGVTAQAAKYKAVLELPTNLFGESIYQEYDKDMNMTIYAFEPVKEDTIEDYVTVLAEDLDLELEKEVDEELLIYTVYDGADIYVMVLKDMEAEFVYVAMFHDNVEVIEKEAPTAA